MGVEIDPAAFADAQARRFTGRRRRVGHSEVVHDITWKAWLGDLTLPVAACNQGWSGLAATDDLMATDDPANCRKCALTAGTAAARRAPPFQTVLFDLDLDTLAVDVSDDVSDGARSTDGRIG